MTNLSKGKNTVGCKWVFTVKYNTNGYIERYNAKLVAKGFTQTYETDYRETFAMVAKINSIRVLSSVATNFNWPLHQLDVKNVFLNGDLEEVFICLPLDLKWNRKRTKFADYMVSNSPQEHGLNALER